MTLEHRKHFSLPGPTRMANERQTEMCERENAHVQLQILGLNDAAKLIVSVTILNYIWGIGCTVCVCVSVPVCGFVARFCLCLCVRMPKIVFMLSRTRCVVAVDLEIALAG